MEANDNFDWNSDQYTKAMRDILDESSKDVLVVMVDDKRIAAAFYESKDEFDPGTYPIKNDFQWKMIKGIGGGSTYDFPTVKLSNKLLLYSDPANGGEKDGSAARTNHTLGGIFLHEFIYHLHPLGDEEEEDPQKMRLFYKIHTYNNEISKKHGSGPNNNSMISKERQEARKAKPIKG